MLRRPGDPDAEAHDLDREIRPRNSRGRVRFHDADAAPQRGEPIREFFNTPIWSYGENTPSEKLLRHWRNSSRLLKASMFAAVLMASSMLEVVLSEPGWWRILWFVVTIASTGTALLLFVPGTIAAAWAKEIDQECGRRGIELSDRDGASTAVQFGAMKMMLYFAGLVLVVNVLGRSAEWRALASVLAVLLTAWTVRSLFKRPRPSPR